MTGPGPSALRTENRDDQRSDCSTNSWFAKLKKLRFFVGVGTKDFARDSASGLHRSLEAAGAASTFREYPEVEHLAIVQLALAGYRSL